MTTVQKVLQHLEEIDEASLKGNRLPSLRCVNLFNNANSGKTNKTYHFEEKDGIFRFVTVYDNKEGKIICWGIAVHIGGRKYKYFQDKEKGKMHRCLEFLADKTEPILREKYTAFFASQINPKFSDSESTSASAFTDDESS